MLLVTMESTSVDSNISSGEFEETTDDTFMEKVDHYVTYQIADKINKYWFPILVPIGLVGNTLSFLVMIKVGNRKMSTCIYMAAISLNDNLMMCSALHNWLVSSVKLYKWHSMECGIASFFDLHVVQNSTYQVIAMTTDKFIAIKWPYKAATYSTPKRAKTTVLSIYICVILYNLPHIFISKLTGDVCLGYAIGGVIAKVYSWFTFVVNAIIPVILLTYINYTIIKKVRESRQMFGNDKIVDQQEDDNVTQRRRTRKNAENQLTIMLLLVTTLFLILMIPTYIRFLYTTFASRDTPVKYASLIFFYHVSHKLYHTNNGINFFLYCVSGQKFRSDVKEILCCGQGSVPNLRYKSQSSDVTTIS